MLMSNSGKKLWPVYIFGLAALLSGMEPSVRGQRPKAVGNQQEKPGLSKLYFGVDTCINCHSKKDPSELKPPPILCRCNEVLTWEKADKHKDAYKNLLGPRGLQMAKLLGIPDVGKEKSCVSCHGVYVAPDKLKELTDPSFKPEDGVSCVACHGPYAEWVNPHGSTLQRDRDKWRSLTRQTKEEQYGMTDLWDPAKRTKMCASCHIGNTDEGKVVTHAMYAAGHPPLPSIEIATFSDEMPRHWQYLREKNERAQKMLGYNPAELERTKLVVVGGAVEFQAAMELLATQAELVAQTGDPESRLLDLARFDCYACHHDLKRPSWRQARGYSGTPGRPQSNSWPLALIKMGILHAGQPKDLDDRLNRLHRAFGMEPFGKLDQIASAARDLANWSQQLKDELDNPNTKYDQASVPRLLRQLCALAALETPDYDTARQMAWAFRVMYSEWMPKPANDAQIAEQLKALNEQLKLTLPSGQEQQILVQLPLALQKISDYDPAPFKQRFEALAKLLPPE
jgi:hypothetical protein